MSLSGIAKFIIGFTLGVSILVAGGVAAGYYFYTKLSVNPPKPIFAEEQKSAPPTKQTTTAAKPAKSSTEKPSPTPSDAESPEKEVELPPGAYKARVSWSEGLSLRDAPGLEANRIGGVAHNQEIIILKESEDKKWQQVRLVNGDQEGWIKAGNIERVQ